MNQVYSVVCNQPRSDGKVWHSFIFLDSGHVLMRQIFTEITIPREVIHKFHAIKNSDKQPKTLAFGNRNILLTDAKTDNPGILGVGNDD